MDSYSFLSGFCGIDIEMYIEKKQGSVIYWNSCLGTVDQYEEIL